MKLLKLPNHYTSGMIFQRNTPILIEGQALESCEITAKLGDDTACINTQAGHFSLTLPPRKADRGLNLTITANSQTLTLTDIYIGEVWFASGQSNMQWPLNDTDEYRQNQAVKANSDLRFYNVGRNLVSKACDLDENYQWAFSADHGWVGCDEESAYHFSAVAYHFAHTLYEAIEVPIGIINCNVGGSSIFSWIPHELLEHNPDLRFKWDEYNTQIAMDPAKTRADFYKYLDETKQTHDVSNNVAGLNGELPVVYYAEPGLYNFQRPDILYTTMLERVSTFPAKGMMWYQGESEAGYEGANHYAAALEALVVNMKERQQNPDFAFNYVQIAPYEDAHVEFWPRVCDQMRRFFLHHPDYAMITIGDVGCAKDIHPQLKRPVGERLAYGAMHRQYDIKREFTGPIAEKALRWGDDVRICFIHGAGLHQRPMKMGRFELVYEGDIIKEAAGEIRDGSLYIPLPDHKTPMLVRYEFVPCPEIGLFNMYGYPASLFEIEVE